MKAVCISENRGLMRANLVKGRLDDRGEGRWRRPIRHPVRHRAWSELACQVQLAPEVGKLSGPVLVRRTLEAFRGKLLDLLGGAFPQIGRIAEEGLAGLQQLLTHVLAQPLSVLKRLLAQPAS